MFLVDLIRRAGGVGYDRFFLAAVFVALLVGAPLVPASASAGTCQVDVAAGRIAFQRGDFRSMPDGGWGVSVDGISVMALDGSDRWDVTDPTAPDFDREPEWSPDGRALVFHRYQDGVNSVQLVDVTSGAISFVDVGFSASWSPDGRHLAWVRPGTNGSELVVAPVESTRSGARITSDGSWVVARGAVGGASWSALGTQLAFTVGRPGEDFGDLWAVNIDGSDLRRLTSGLDVEVISPAQPSWSPASDLVAFVVAEPGADGGYYDVPWVVPAAGGPAIRLGGNDHVSWAPHGQLLVTATVSGDADVLLFTPAGQVAAELDVPGISSLTAPEWAADGLHLLAIAQPDDWSEPPDLYRINLLDLTAHRLTTGHEAFPDGLSSISPGVSVRLFGQTRTGTAVALSRETFEHASTIVLARADVYPDALVAGPLAVSLGGPVLLSYTDQLPTEVRAEIARLGPSAAVLMGGPGALSTSIESELRALGVTNLQRLEGNDRFEVAANVAQRIAHGHAFVVEGIHPDPSRGWPDAVAVSGLAATRVDPILLVSRDAIPAATQQALRDNDIAHVTIVGGQAAVSDDVEKQLRALGVTVERIWGQDRYATSTAVADEMFADGSSPRDAIVVTGQNWPDAVTAGSNLASNGMPVLLVPGDTPADTASTDWIEEHVCDLELIHLLGGRAAVTPSVAVHIEQRAS